MLLLCVHQALAQTRDDSGANYTCKEFQSCDGKNSQVERCRRVTVTDRQRERQRERERERGRERQRQTETQTERDRDRQRQTERERDKRERESQRDRETDCLFIVLVLISVEDYVYMIDTITSLVPSGTAFWSPLSLFLHCLYLFLFIIYFRSRC